MEHHTTVQGEAHPIQSESLLSRIRAPFILAHQAMLRSDELNRRSFLRRGIPYQIGEYDITRVPSSRAEITNAALADFDSDTLSPEELATVIKYRIFPLTQTELDRAAPTGSVSDDVLPGVTQKLVAFLDENRTSEL